MFRILGKGLALADVLLVPKYSEVSSRKAVSLAVSIKDLEFHLPFVPSNMKTITEVAMARLMFEKGGMAIFHRFESFEVQQGWLRKVGTWDRGLEHVGFSVGVKKEDRAYALWFIEHGVRILCIDLAHGDSKHCLEMIAYIREEEKRLGKNVLLIAGNVATGEGAKRIWKAGADICKIGIGMGSTCLTRINTGNGVPTMTCLMQCYEAKLEMEEILQRKLYMMQDGGCSSSGDVLKCLSIADFVMSGNMFAASDEAAAPVIEKNGKTYKSYVGSSTHRGSHKEGVEALIKTKGPAAKIIEEMCEGLQSGCSYQNSLNLEDLKKNPEFMTISHAGIIESHAHDLDEIVS